MTVWARPLLITQGAGGDAKGAELLQILLKKHCNPEFIHIGQLPLIHIDVSSYNPVVFIGQRAVEDLVEFNQIIPLLRSKQIGVYSHLLDNNLLTWLKQKQAAIQHIILYVTDSQLKQLKRHQPTMYHALSVAKNIEIKTAPGVIQTVAPEVWVDLHAEPWQTINQLDVIIWLGGHYTDSNGIRQMISTEQFVKHMKQLALRIPAKAKVGVILSPRFVENHLSAVAQAARLRAIQQAFTERRVTFYGHAETVQYFRDEGIRIQLSPAYSDLIAYFRQTQAKGVELFASVDQYNLFSDLSQIRIVPFLLNEEDQDQAAYQADYLAHKQYNTLTTIMMQHMCDNK